MEKNFDNKTYLEEEFNEAKRIYFDELTKRYESHFSIVNDMSKELITLTPGNQSIIENLLKLTALEPLFDPTEYSLIDIKHYYQETLNVDYFNSPLEIYEELLQNDDVELIDFKSFYIDALIRIAFLIKTLYSYKQQHKALINDPQRKFKSKFEIKDGLIDLDKEISKREIYFQSDLKGIPNSSIIKRKESLEQIKNIIKPLQESILKLEKILKLYEDPKYIGDKGICNEKCDLFENNNINSIDKKLLITNNDKTDKKMVIVDSSIKIDKDSKLKNSEVNSKEEINSSQIYNINSIDSETLDKKTNNFTTDDGDFSEKISELFYNIDQSFEDSTKIGKIILINLHYFSKNLTGKYKFVDEINMLAKQNSLKLIGILDLKILLDKFFSYLEEEGHKFLFTIEIKELEKNYSEIISLSDNSDMPSVNCKEKLDNMICYIEKIYDYVDPLNMYAIKAYLDIAKKEIMKVKDKNIIIPIGYTGAGKSTFIQYLKGIKFEKLDQNAVNIRPIIQSKEDQDFINQFVARNSGKSVTRFVKFDEIPIYTKGSKSFHIVDSAGLSDTSTKNVEIANNISIIEAMSMSKEVSIVFLLTNQFGDRLQDLNKIPEYISYIVKDKDNNFNNINYLVNKLTDENVIEKFIKNCEEIDDEMNNSKYNSEIKRIFSEMLNIIVDKRYYMNFTDPKINVNDLIRDLVKKTIKAPMHSFNIYVSNNVSKSLELYFNVKEKTILSLIKINKYESVLNIFILLKEFTELFSSTFGAKFSSLLNIVKSELEKTYDSFIKYLKSSFDFGNTLSKETIEGIFKLLEIYRSDSFQKLEKQVYDDVKDFKEKYITLKETIKAIISSLANEIVTYSLQSNNNKEVEKINLSLFKMSEIKKYELNLGSNELILSIDENISKIKNHYIKCNDNANKIIKNLINSKSLKIEDLDKIENFLKLSLEIDDTYEFNIKNNTSKILNEMYEYIISLAKEYIVDLKKISGSMFDKDEFSSFLNVDSEIFNLFDGDHYNNQNKLYYKYLLEMKKMIITEINNEFNKLLIPINPDNFKADKLIDNAISQINENVSKMTIIISLKCSRETNINNDYSKFKNIVKQYLNQYSSELKYEIKNYTFIELDFEDIHNKIGFIKSYNFIFENKENFDIHLKVESTINSKLVKQNEELKIFEFRDTEPEELNNYYGIYKKILSIQESFSEKSEIFIKSKEIIDECVKKFNTDIIEYFTSDNYDVEKNIRSIENHLIILNYYLKKDRPPFCVSKEQYNIFIDKIKKFIDSQRNEFGIVLNNVMDDIEKNNEIVKNKEFFNLSTKWRKLKNILSAMQKYCKNNEQDYKDFYNEIFEKCHKIFINISKSFEEKRKELNKKGVDLIKVNLFELQQLDSIVLDEENETINKYSFSFNKLKKEVEEETSKFDSEIEIHANNLLCSSNTYAELKTFMKNLNTNDKLKIEGCIIKKHANLTTEIKTILNNFEEYQNDIESSGKKIDKGFDFQPCSVYILDREELKKLFPETLKQITNDIEEFLNGVLDYVEYNNDTKEISNKKRHLLNIQKLLMQITNDDQDIKLNKLSYIKERLDKSLKSLDKHWGAHFENKMQKYKNILNILSEEKLLTDINNALKEDNKCMTIFLKDLTNKISDELETANDINFNENSEVFFKYYSYFKKFENNKEIIASIFNNFSEIENLNEKLKKIYNQINVDINNIIEETSEEEIRNIEKMIKYDEFLNSKYKEKVNVIKNNIKNKNLDFFTDNGILCVISALNNMIKFGKLKESQLFIDSKGIESQLTVKKIDDKEICKFKFISHMIKHFSKSKPDKIIQNFEHIFMKLIKDSILILCETFSKLCINLDDCFDKKRFIDTLFNDYILFKKIEENYSDINNSLSSSIKSISSDYPSDTPPGENIELSNSLNKISELNKYNKNYFDKKISLLIEDYYTKLYELKENFSKFKMSNSFFKESEFIEAYANICSLSKFYYSFNSFFKNFDNNGVSKLEFKEVLQDIKKIHIYFFKEIDNIIPEDEPQKIMKFKHGFNAFNQERNIENILNIKSEFYETNDNISRKIDLMIKENDSKMQTLIKINDRENLCEVLRKFYKFAFFCTEYNESIVKIISKHFKNKNSKEIDIICGILDNHEDGSYILQDIPIFKFKNRVMQELTEKQDIEYVLNNIKAENDKIDKNKLFNLFSLYHDLFEHLQKQIRKGKETKESIINYIIKNGKKFDLEELQSEDGFFKSVAVFMKIVKNRSDKLVELLSYISILWSINKSPEYYNVQSESEYGVKPHPAQILAVIRVLCCDSGVLKNNLIEMQTGEGKSVLLALTSTILALQGCKVFVGCYSLNLSERDQTEMRNMIFNDLNITHMIEYSNFQNLTEMALNEKKDIREMSVNLILKKNDNYIKKSNSYIKVLLIDEVDILFTKEFFGEKYNPCGFLKDDKITAVIKFIWANKDVLTSNNVQNIKNLIFNSSEYNECLNCIFKDCKSLLDSQIYKLISDLKVYKSCNQYEIINDRICYKQQDIFTDKLNYGYKTLFTYIDESSKGRIKNSIEDEYKFLIDLGCFSYLEIIKNNFQFIMGVSGTINSLYPNQKKIINEFLKIEHYTSIPSIYGLKTYRNEKTMFIADEDSIHISSIITEIKQANDLKQPVLIFLDEILDLQKLSLKLDSLNIEYKTVKESDTSNDILKVVKESTKPGSITLLTRSFGRGTDFEMSTLVASKGGCLGIQTFIHEDKSEHIQIKGRVARQGRKGDYFLTIQKSDLEKINFDMNYYENNKNNYGVLSQEIEKAIEKKFNEKFKGLMIKNNECLSDHKESMNLVNKLLDETKKSEALQDIEKINYFAFEISACYIFIAIDATGSMSDLFEDTKNCINSVFKRTKEMLTEKKINKNFYINIGLYRNYSSGKNQIYESSGWCCDVKEIEIFLINQGVSGGQGNEAIEVALHNLNLHLNSSDLNIQNAILIGDAAPNTKEEVKKNKKPMLKDFVGTNYEKDLYYEFELEKIINSKVKIDTYYLDNRAKESFGEIANKTNGKCEFLDIKDPKSKEILTGIFSTTVLKEIGGEELVKDYFKKYSYK